MSRITHICSKVSPEGRARVKVHTGIGNDTSSDLYWNKNAPIWNNDGDVATLKDASEDVIFSYPKETKGA